MTGMETKEVIAEMLIENTGRHMLDSGGAYGRHWEQNQAALKERTAVEFFESQPVATWDYGPTLNVYHFLNAAVDYAPSLDRAWYKWVYSGPEDRYINGMSTVDEFIDQLVEKGWAYSDTWPNEWINTYNYEDALSQVLQYRCFRLTEDCPWEADTPSWSSGHVVLLSIHGGCDVRGGYTGYRAFAHSIDESPSLWDNARVTLYCTNDECKEDKWGQHFVADSDNAGYNWYSEYIMPDGERFDGKFGERDWPTGTPEYQKDQIVPVCPICYSDLSVGGFCY